MVCVLCTRADTPRVDLVDTARYGDLNGVKAALAAGADVNAEDQDGHTALVWATEGGRLDVVQTLLAAKADVNAKDRDGLTALMWAAEDGDLELARALLAAKADVNREDQSGHTALWHAKDGAIWWRGDMVRLIQRWNAAEPGSRGDVMPFWKKGLVGVPWGDLSGGEWTLPILVFLISTAIIVWKCVRIGRAPSTPGLTIHELSSLLMGNSLSDTMRAAGSFAIVGAGWFTIYWGLGQVGVWWIVLLTIYLLVFSYITAVAANG